MNHIGPFYTILSHFGQFRQFWMGTSVQKNKQTKQKTKQNNKKTTKQNDQKKKKPKKQKTKKNK